MVTRGYKVVHIKTDSLKIPNIDQNAIDICHTMAKLAMGINSNTRCTFDRMCLVNDAVYISKYDSNGLMSKGGRKAGKWSATGAQFAVPYVFKKLFSREQIDFSDLCEVKEVTNSAMYLADDEYEDGETKTEAIP